MDAEHLRAYLARDWDAIARAKHAYWVERHRVEGPQATWDASQALRAAVQRIRPDYPSAADRATDMEAHLHLRELLDRTAHAFTRR